MRHGLARLCTKNPVSMLTHRSIRPFRPHFEGFFATKEACFYSKNSYKGTTFGAKPVGATTFPHCQGAMAEGQPWRPDTMHH
jgi:hypothetical protein